MSWARLLKRVFDIEHQYLACITEDLADISLSQKDRAAQSNTISFSSSY